MKLSTDPQQAAQQLRDYLTTADLSRCQGKVVADKFGVHPNTLNRRLLQARTSWQFLKHAERKRRLAAILDAGIVRHALVADMLGLSGRSACRFIKEQTGMCLDEYYRQRRAA